MVHNQTPNLCSIILFLCFQILLHQESKALGLQFSKTAVLKKLSSISVTKLKFSEDQPYSSLFPSLSLHQAVQNPAGLLGGETCFVDSTCARGNCVSNGPVPCEANRTDCVCSIFSCDNGGQCAQGEICSPLTNGNSSCLSESSRLIQRNGSLTGGPCQNTADCATNRDCFPISSSESQLCSSTDDSCLCLPLTFITCDNVGSTDGCLDGEICEQIGNSSLCVDPFLSTTGTGLTLDPCQSNANCLPPRSCAALVNDSLVQCSPNSNDCRCIPESPINCNSSDDCTTSGEVCNPSGNSSLCISESVALEITSSGESSMMTEMDMVLGR